MINNLTVVIRTVGEVTTELCYKQLKEVVDEKSIFYVKNVSPFCEAIRRSYQIGIDNKKKWTLIIDADVLIYPASVMKLLKTSDRFALFHKKIFCINGLLYDKALSIPRIVGMHLYRTKYLSIAMKYVNDGKMELRPETYIKVAMGEAGYRTYVSDLVLGVHDFFQRPIDLLRKGFLHRKKHIGYDATFEKWEYQKKDDLDFFWLSEGAKMGESVSEFPGVDAEAINILFNEYKDKCEDVLDKDIKMDDIWKKYIIVKKDIVWERYFGPDDIWEKMNSKLNFWGL